MNFILAQKYKDYPELLSINTFNTYIVLQIFDKKYVSFAM